MFWSGDKLEKNKKNLVKDKEGNWKNIEVDCAAISLTVGDEVYVTPNDDKSPNVKQILDEKDPQFIIPKGQFALIMTAECVTVPVEALAFISFKAKYKFKGLINVSGFHVDPGWVGHLIFSVYNAGPANIVLERGKPFALIWYADLDSTATSEFAKKSVKFPQAQLDSDKVSDMTGEVFSPFKLKKELEELKKEVTTLESKIVTRYSAVIFAVFTAVLGFAMKDVIINFAKTTFPHIFP